MAAAAEAPSIKPFAVRIQGLL